MGREDKVAWKSQYVVKLLVSYINYLCSLACALSLGFSLQSLFDEYARVLLVNVDNVGSKQMQQIRISLRGKAVILMGKNTTIRKAIRGNLDQNPQLEKLLPHVKGNVGFVFTNDDLQDVREIILTNQVSFEELKVYGCTIIC